jgi:ABC-type lipoprotein release transport system permease subunit
MKNIIFLMVMVFLLTGCAGKVTDLKLRSEVDVKSEQGLPVKIKAQGEEPLPIKIVPDEIAVGALIASLIAVVATSLAAIAAWRAAYNTKKVLEKIKKRSDE